MTRATFLSDGLSISYLDEGVGDPILLVHGFASNAEVNWVGPGWVSALNAAGFRVIALDNRGHGASDKPHDPARYRSPEMAEDVRRLMDHLGIARADVMGYSMGARISAFLALNHPGRVRSFVSGGLGLGLVDGVGDAAVIVEALLAPSLQQVPSQRGRMFRAFADQTKSDRIALAACMSAMRELIPAETVRRISVPTLVAVGTKDAIAGSAGGLADLIPGAEVLDIPDRDHMPAVGDRVYKAGVLRFLESRP